MLTAFTVLLKLLKGQMLSYIGFTGHQRWALFEAVVTPSRKKKQNEFSVFSWKIGYQQLWQSIVLSLEEYLVISCWAIQICWKRVLVAEMLCCPLYLELLELLKVCHAMSTINSFPLISKFNVFLIWINTDTLFPFWPGAKLIIVSRGQEKDATEGRRFPLLRVFWCLSWSLP